MKHPTAMLLDEFSNFGRIAGIGDTLSIIRKNRIGMLLGFQNYNQLEQVYSRKEAQIIIDMPATQVYFKQKNFREARELSEALGRTTVEDVTVNDTGRVQEFIQGRALATPDELINLSGEVIVFTNDTSPLKLPITPPDAYQQALQYPAPERPKHQISDNTRRRGKCAEQQPKSQESSEKPKPAPEDRRQANKDRKRKERTVGDKPQDNNGNPPRTTSETDSPEVDDIWPL